MGTVKGECREFMRKEVEISYWYILGNRLFGNIYNHPTIPDGDFVMTTEITKIEGSLVYTEKARYKLLKGYFEVNEDKDKNDIITPEVTTIDDLAELVIDWGYEKGILLVGDAQAQTLKTVSEVGELADNIAKDNDVRDDIGDILVTLILLAEIKNTSLFECLDIAYSTIANRKGQMVNGVFVKEEC